MKQESKVLFFREFTGGLETLCGKILMQKNFLKNVTIRFGHNNGEKP